MDSVKVLGERPPPPPLPKYDPEKEAPMWNWDRINWGLPVDKGPIPWTPVGTQPDSPDKPDWRGVIRNQVIELPMPEPYNHGRPVDPKYFWFDTPDYADPFKKLGYSTRFFGIIALTSSLLVGTFQNMSFNVPNHFMLVRNIFGPIMAAGLGASVTVISLANLRGKKDDMYNYFWGGLVAGLIMGRKSPEGLFRWNVGTVPASLFVKYNAETNGELVPIYNFRRTKYSLRAGHAEHGLLSGDLRLGVRSSLGDPGRDVRKTF